jgi:predicted integral membrane protein DUF2269
MAMRNFLLTLHIFGAIAGFGSTFAFPFIGALAKQPGAPVPWFLRLTEKIATRWVDIFAIFVVPGTGAGLIITQHVSPWDSQNRWLLAAISVYTLAFVFSHLVQARNTKTAIRMADAQQYGPEFGALMKKVAMGGQLLTVMLITIIILMVVKP